MVSLTNQARLLAAQAFNKRILEEKARARKAEIVAEAQKQVARSTRRLVVAKANARNPVEAAKIQASINQVKKSSAEKARVNKIVTVARQKLSIATQRAFGASAGRVGILTGFKARVDKSGRVQGISKTESATRKNTKRLLLTEIRNQQKIRDRETDLERFLKNERALGGVQFSKKAFASLKQQIAKRKARGLSKTPAQKRAFFRLQEQEDLVKLRARNKRRGRTSSDKRFSSAEAIIARKRSEAGRAGDLGSSPFADDVFAFGGRTRAEQIARGGTFGRRLQGESASDQINFLKQTRERTTGARIDFAQSLLDGALFGSSFDDASSEDLLSIIGSQTKDEKTGRVSQIQFAPRTFEQEIREGVGFFTTEAIPDTTAKISKGERRKLVSARKAEDFAIATESRETIRATKAKTARKQRENQDDLRNISASLLVSNTRRGQQIERQNALAPPRVSRQGQFTLGGIGVSQQGSPFGDPTSISLVGKRSAFDVGRGSIEFGGQTGLTRGQAFALASDRRRQATALTAQNKLGRGQRSFSVPTRASAGFGAKISGFAQQQQARKGRQLTVSVSERLAISARAQPKRTKPTDAQLRARIRAGKSVPSSDFSRLTRGTRSSRGRKSRKKTRSSSSRSRTSGFKSPSSTRGGSAGRSSGGGDPFSGIRGGIDSAISSAKFLGTLATGGNPFTGGRAQSPREALSGIVPKSRQGSLDREIAKNLGFG